MGAGICSLTVSTGASIGVAWGLVAFTRAEDQRTVPR